MILRQLQDLIGGIYDVSLAHDVYDFLCTDRGSLPGQHAGRDEQLIVATGADHLDVSLYLDPALLERLRVADPMQRLDAANVADWCTALEGVSHFVYLAWNAGHDRDVSLLELELQAEIDKYVASCWLLRRQFPDRYPSELRHVLFERARVDPALAGERAPLYRAASHYAERFCRRIERALREGRAEPERQVLAELRRFYRLTDARKRAHIEKAADG
jgi:hypothetical protein